MLDYLSVGYVLKPQGIKGEIKVKPLTDDMERFEDLPYVYLKDLNGYKPLKIKTKRYQKDCIYLKLEGYDSINEVEPLRGQYLWIPREMAVELPEDTYFIADLIDCAVETTEGEVLGELKRIIQTGSNDVYVVEGSRGEILIPALKKVVREVNLESRKIVVYKEELEGLLTDED